MSQKKIAHQTTLVSQINTICHNKFEKMSFLLVVRNHFCWSRYCGPSNFTFVESLSDTKTWVLVPEFVTNKCCCVTNKSNILENMGTGTWYWQQCCETCISVSNRFPICLGAHPAYFHAFCDPETPNVTNKYMSQINTCYCQTNIAV